MTRGRQAERAEDLHRALMERRCARVDRGTDMALDHQVRHPVLGEQGGRRQPDEAAAHHEDRRVSLRHPKLPPA